MHNDAVVQGLSEVPFMQDVKRWGVLTIGTGLGNARFTNRQSGKALDANSTNRRNIRIALLHRALIAFSLADAVEIREHVLNRRQIDEKNERIVVRKTPP